MRLVDRFRAKHMRMSRNQRIIAEFIVARPEECAFLTAGELGRRVGVSESTVVRFAVAVGFPGYPELQRAMQEELRQRLSTVERMEAGREGIREPEDMLQAVWQNDVANVNRTFHHLPKDDFDRAVAMLAQARHIYVIGLRTSACVAVLLTTALRYLGKNASQIDLGVGDYWERLDAAGPEDVVFGISVPRYTRWATEMLSYARRKRIPTVVLTDNPVSPLSEFADVTLPAVTDFNAFIESFVAPLRLVNALILGVALHDEQRTLEVLRQREGLWREKQLYDRADHVQWGDAAQGDTVREHRLLPVTGEQYRTGG